MVVHVPFAFGLRWLGSAFEVLRQICLHHVSVCILIMVLLGLLLSISSSRTVCWLGWCRPGSALPSSQVTTYIARSVTKDQRSSLSLCAMDLVKSPHCVCFSKDLSLTYSLLKPTECHNS
ncbi:hypothetical protein Bca4012_071634 [Brassica carinata]